eukprot:CAMPEP_0116935668 /NCGR_PEP_ID=MMETSP0467-20121206/30427_1 /TAXON_ID=283647 /ORGANISM="Mesodinium pulex, Strain SPMC105" /LENGTH=137 /DNA_ID=CAMNT_0004617099 /DNA_START=205 /DNA_END=616 /DNA_ORIENTATION=+
MRLNRTSDPQIFKTTKPRATTNSSSSLKPLPTRRSPSARTPATTPTGPICPSSTLDSRDYKACLEACEQALKLNPANVSATANKEKANKEIASELCTKAYGLKELNRQTEANKVYDQALDLDQENKDANDAKYGSGK